MELTFSVRYYRQNLAETYYKLFTIYIYIYIYIGPILFKAYLRRDTQPCESLEKILGLNTEIAAEQFCFSAMDSTSHNTIN